MNQIELKQKYRNTALIEIIGSQFPQTENKKLQKVINECINNKILSYYQFLVAKMSFNQIKHRKIVCKICMKYIPQNKLYLNCLGSNYFILHQENLEKIKSCLNNLPNLQSLELYVKVIKQDDLISIVNCLKNIFGLKNLSLSLESNYLLGKYGFDFKYIGDSLKSLYKLEYLNLNLERCMFYMPEENMKQLGNMFKMVSQSLIRLDLNLSDNQLGDNQQNLKYLGLGLRHLRNLQHLELYLFNNNLGENQDNLKYLGDGLLQLVNLKNLELYLDDNDIGENEKQKLKNECLNILVQLDYLYFD